MCVKSLPPGSKPLIVLHQGGLVLPEGPYTGTNAAYLGNHGNPTAFSTAGVPTPDNQFSLKTTQVPTLRPTAEVCGVGHYMLDPIAVSALGDLHPRVDRTQISARPFLCLTCAPGKFVDAKGYGMCFKCPHGKYQPQKGQWFCDVCPPGGTSSLVHTSCVTSTAPTAAPSPTPTNNPTP